MTLLPKSQLKQKDFLPFNNILSTFQTNAILNLLEILYKLLCRKDFLISEADRKSRFDI